MADHPTRKGSLLVMWLLTISTPPRRGMLSLPRTFRARYQVRKYSDSRLRPIHHNHDVIRTSSADCGADRRSYPVPASLT